MIPYIQPQNNFVVGADGAELRTLEAQVQDNTEKIAQHYNRDRVLADFGIRVLGQLDSASQLDNLTGPFEYGDAYAIGTKAPYSFYIWTRGALGTGHPDDYWFDIGDLAIVGPIGPTGPAPIISNNGVDIISTDPVTQETVDVIPIQTIRGSKWFAGKTLPSGIEGVKDNDLYLNTATGTVYQYKDAHWFPLRSIKGPKGDQGIQGKQGEQGEQGPQGEIGPRGLPAFLYKVAGIVANVSQLPAPEPQEVSDNDLYLVGSSGHFNMYAVINGSWTNLGPIALGVIGGQNAFVAYNQFGDQITSMLYQNSLIFRNFNTDSLTGLVNGCLVVNIPYTYPLQIRGNLWSWLYTNGYTNASSSFYPASGFSFNSTQNFHYFGVAADPNVTNRLLFVGYREDRTDPTAALQQASWPFFEDRSSGSYALPSIHYNSIVIPPSGTL